jgi:hypothetical protein
MVTMMRKHTYLLLPFFLLVLLISLAAPLRSQNYALKVLAEKEHPLHAKHNAIIFTDEHVLLQLAQYKTKE